MAFFRPRSKPARHQLHYYQPVPTVFDDAGFGAELSYSPQPVFHPINRPKSTQNRAQKQQYITPEHNEMIQYVQQSWKGVEPDYKQSVNNFIGSLEMKEPLANKTTLNDTKKTISNFSEQQKKHGSISVKKKLTTTSTPLLLPGSYHHTSKLNNSGKDSVNGMRQDSFKPFDLETFWGNRILKRLTDDL